jgi:hypothetical protein
MMTWYFKAWGKHTHVRVFMNGAKCGTLTFRNEEFKLLQHEEAHRSTPLGKQFAPFIKFVEEAEVSIRRNWTRNEELK